MKHFLFLALLMVAFTCCQNPVSDLKTDNINGEYAIPLVSAKTTLGDLVLGNVANTSLEIGTDGKVTVLYNGDVLEKGADDVFPPIPGLGYFLLMDSVSNQSFSFASQNEIHLGIFKGDKIHFRYRSDLEEDITVTMTVPEIQKDGQPLTQTVVLDYDGTTPVELTTEDIDLKGWSLISDDNSVTFNYDARRPNGERIELDKAWMNYSLLEFEYIEGFFPRTVYEIAGDFVPIGLYKGWISGSMDFQDPKVTISLENSFGFPVATEINDLHIKTLGWEVLFLESPLIEDGIYFDYPGVNEIGEVKFSSFSFDTTNSNLDVIFNNRIRQLNYDINSVANPDDDPNLTGYFTDSSYFKVNVAVEVPMNQSIDHLTLTDTFDVSFEEFDQIQEAEFKLVVDNTYPVDVGLQVYFINNTTVLDSMFVGEFLEIPSANLGAGGTTTSQGEVVRLMTFDEERFLKVKGANRLSIKPIISTINEGTEPIWLYDDYSLDTRVGVKFKTQ